MSAKCHPRKSLAKSSQADRLDVQSFRNRCNFVLFGAADVAKFKPWRGANRLERAYLILVIYIYDLIHAPRLETGTGRGCVTLKWPPSGAGMFKSTKKGVW